MVKEERFINVMQHSVAVFAIGPSSLRNQGAPGIIDAARNFLSVLDLTYFNFESREDFESRLNKTTDCLLKALPEKAQNWGAARKAINLFLKDALYNYYLSREYDLRNIESYLEIPLDSAIARGLRKEGKRGELPIWPGLKKLTPPISSRFQSFAEDLAGKRGLARVHLDMYLWLQERK
jgi:hypothetical protein